MKQRPGVPDVMRCVKEVVKMRFLLYFFLSAIHRQSMFDLHFFFKMY